MLVALYFMAASLCGIWIYAIFALIHLDFAWYIHAQVTERLGVVGLWLVFYNVVYTQARDEILKRKEQNKK